MPMHVAACSPMQWHTFPLLLWATWPRQSKGKVCQCMWLHAAPCNGILFTYCYGPHGPDKLGKSMPMHVAACSHTHWHAFPRLFWAMWPRQIGENYANACGCMQPPMHWHSFPLLVWATWPGKVGEKYANAWGCIQLHALAYFAPTVLGHMA